MKAKGILLVLLATVLMSAACDNNENNTAAPHRTASSSAVQVTFIELGSVNCIPCRAMQKIMKEIESEYGDQVKIIFYDVWKVEQARYGELYKIRSIPTQVFLDRDGIEYFRHEGYFPKADLVAVLKQQGVK